MPVDDFASKFIGNEPVGSLLILLTAFLLFIVAQQKTRVSSLGLGGLLNAGGTTIAFLGLTMGFYLFIQGAYDSFSALYGSIGAEGSLARIAWLQVRRDYPDWVSQQELQVAHYVETTQEVEVPNPDPAKPPLYKTVMTREAIPQNSIKRFRGTADVTLEDKENYLKAGAYNRFSVDASYEYLVGNVSEQKTQAEFTFPLSHALRYENFSVLINGRESFSQAIIVPQGLFWKRDMDPGEEVLVKISYRTQGENNFIYALPRREINDFVLVLNTNIKDINIFASPTGNNFQVRASNDKEWFVTTFEIDDAYLQPSMGCGFVAKLYPYDPYKPLVGALRYSARATLFWAVIFTLTSLIAAQTFSPRLLALSLALLCGEFLIVMIAGTFAPTWKTVLFSASGVTVIAALLLLRKLQRVPFILSMLWFIFFSGPYSLMPEKFADATQRNSFESIFLAALVAYVFALTLFIRLRLKTNSS